MKRNNKKGFTIIELVVVIAVIAILAAVLIPTFSSIIKKANESVDIQAAKNMNTFLATADITDGVDSILDVYDVFEESDYIVENYAPLYKGRSYFYSAQDNMILYVDDATGEVLYPDSLKNTTQGSKVWLSLNMKGVTSAKPADNNYTYTAANNSTAAKIVATVAKAEEYLYVIEQYNELSEEGAEKLDLELTINGTLDMKGTQCMIAQVSGNVTIKGSGENSKGTLKNITSVDAVVRSSNNDQNVLAEYSAGALIAKAEGEQDAKINVTIQDLVIENANVRTITGGDVALVVGTCGHYCDLTIKNVDIKNSTVIGHRGVAAYIGQLMNQTDKTTTIENCTTTNVAVKTVGGKAARMVGFCYGRNQDKGKLQIKNTTSDGITLSVYESSISKQTYSTTKPSDAGLYKDCEKYITSIKVFDTNATATYGYYSDADVLVLTTESNATIFVKKSYTDFSGNN